MHPAVLRVLLFPGTLLAVVDAAPAAPPPHRPLVPGYERFFTGDRTDPVRAGRLLAGELGCAACHADPAAPGRRQAPVLTEIGARARASWLRKFLRDPHAIKPGTLMPDLLHDGPDRDQKIEALVHLLVSTGTLRHERPPPRGISQGRDLYHKVGCVACHGTRDGSGKPDRTFPTSVPLPDLAAKYSISSLAAFLENPLHSRPSGRMPRLLNTAEAKAVSSYLLQGAKMPLVGRGTARYAYYEGGWNEMPNFKELKPRAKGTTAGFDIGVARRDHNFALVFEAVWKVEREALYTFVLSSDDGSKLSIDDRLVVDNDGIHATQSRSGKVQLSPGIHRVRLEFFQGGGEATLDVRVQATGFGNFSLGDLVAATEADLEKKARVQPSDEDALAVRPELVEKGTTLFASLGCASCHTLARAGKPLPSSLKAPPLARLPSGKGCLAAKPAAGVPRFGLDDRQRQALAAGLTAQTPPRTPATVIHETLTALNCYACHVRDRVGGPEEAVNRHFLTTQPEMGDEGRLPPPLDGIGAKLTPDYFRHLLDRGVNDRPYMHTRMPGFGTANTQGLIEAFAALDRLPAAPEVTFAEPEHRVKSQARHLVGGLALGCIKCHTFNGVKAEGVQGIDMTLMPRKLRRDWFHAYVSDPARLRPGTRMPASFLNGKSVLPSVLDGTATTQIEAMWRYLQDGSKARLPVGMGKVSIPLVPTEGAIIYRNFIEGAGTRAIAVGYPEKAHLAFDANDGRLALLWQGAFLDAARHWTDRGSGYEGPLGDNVLRLAGGPTFAVLDTSQTPWPGSYPGTLPYRFRGYRLSRDDRPTFLYSIGEVRVEDCPNPVVHGKEVGMRRTFTLKAEKPIANFHYRAAAAARIEPTGDGWYRIDGSWKVKVPAGARVRKAGSRSELVFPVTFQDGKAEIVQEYAW